MCGFAAASYQRGVHFIQIPTTLMAMVDSSVGGKTGVNHPLGKNMIGAFYQPRCVLVDTTTLDTLPARELASGVAEVVKYGLIRDAPFFEWLEKNVDKVLSRDDEVRRPIRTFQLVLCSAFQLRRRLCVLLFLLVVSGSSLRLAPLCMDVDEQRSKVA